MSALLTRLRWARPHIAKKTLRSSSTHSTASSNAADVDEAEAVIVGGGAVGASVAYHLSRLGMRDVVLLEKSELTAGSTWHAAGLAALYHSGINMKRIHYYSINLYSQLEEETGQPLGFHRPGSIRLATTEERMTEFRYQMQRQGWQQAPQKLITPDEIHVLCPILDMQGILGGLYNPVDGHIDPNSLTMSYAMAARGRGVRIRLDTPVTGLRTRSDGRWEVDTDKGTILAKRVVNAAGFWAKELGAMSGLDLPLVPVQHQYMVTKPIPQVQEMKWEMPVLRHLAGSFYMRAERGGLLVGPYEKPHKMKVVREWAEQGVPPGFGKELFQPDLDRLQEHLEVAMSLVPSLSEADVRTVVNGPITYTPDLLPLLGPVHGQPPGMWMAAGFGYGIIHSGGAGKYLADWMVKGEPPFDLIETDPNRFGKWTTKDYVCTKSAETYGMNNSYTYPKEERWAGRPTSRVSGAYQDMLDRGAEMGFHAGWEQPAWFATSVDDKGYKPSFRRTNWFQAVNRECKLVMDKVGVLDLTPFAKIDAKGPGAAAFLDTMLANRLPKVGRTNISHMLTPKGRVYAELTVTRLAEDHFFLITGSGSEIHDLRWLSDHALQMNSDVQFANLTDEWACLSVAGPLSRHVITKLANEEEFGEKAFPFLAAKVTKVAGVPVRALRISYTGELGWELYHPAQHTAVLYRALLDAGQEFGIGDFGTYALNALRIEKGFRMWGAEMNLDSNPLEAGLDPFVRLDKGAEFIGKAALKEVLREGLSRKLAMLRVDSSGFEVDPEGNESVWCCDKVVGFTTSGCFAPTVNHGLAFAYLPPFLTAPGTALHVELLGHRAAATVLPGAPVDIESVRRKKMKK